MADEVETFHRERDHKDARLRVLLLLSLAGIGILAVVLNSAILSGTPTDPMVFEVFSLEQVYPEALARAVAWQSDARLTQADFDFRPAGTAGPPWAALSFRSASSPHAWLNVFVTEGPEYELSPGEFNDYERPIGQPITPGRLGIDTHEALDISLANGGREYIRNRGDNMLWPQVLFLHYQDDLNETGPVVWRVSYSNSIVGPSLTVLINAETGELLETISSDKTLLD